MFLYSHRQMTWCGFSVIGLEVSKKAFKSPPLCAGYVVYVGEWGGVWRREFGGRVLERHRTEFLTNFRTPWKKKEGRSAFPSCFLFPQKTAWKMDVCRKISKIHGIIWLKLAQKQIFRLVFPSYWCWIGFWIDCACFCSLFIFLEKQCWWCKEPRVCTLTSYI